MLSLNQSRALIEVDITFGIKFHNLKFLDFYSSILQNLSRAGINQSNSIRDYPRKEEINKFPINEEGRKNAQQVVLQIKSNKLQKNI